MLVNCIYFLYRPPSASKPEKLLQKLRSKRVDEIADNSSGAATSGSQNNDQSQNLFRKFSSLIKRRKFVSKKHKHFSVVKSKNIEAINQAKTCSQVAATTSSSNSSLISSGRVFRPPSLFSDSRELSEAECDRYDHHINEGENRKLSDNYRDTIPRSPKIHEPKTQGDIKEELTVILNRIYDHQQNCAPSQEQSSTSPLENERLHTQESDRSTYSINV